MMDNDGSGIGRNGWPLWVITLVAGVSAVLAITNYFLAGSNTQLITEVRERQQVINQAIQLSPLNAQLSQLIANLAQRSGDIDLRAVLERHGISLAENPTSGSMSTLPVTRLPTKTLTDTPKP